MLGEGPFFTSMELLVTLLWATSPVWMGLITGGLAARFMPRFPVIFGLLIGLGVGILVIGATVGLTALVVYFKLPIPYADAIWLIPTVAAVVVTAGFCRLVHWKFY